MEDDDSETSMTIDETAHLERPASSPTTTLQSDSVCKHNASKSVENKDDTSSVECKSNLKSLSCGDIAEIPSEKESGKNGNIVTSDSYVPTSLKKVNGEVKLPEDDQELDISPSTLGSERIRSSQDEEEDKGINSDNTKSKYKSNSVFTSEVIDVKNDCQNFENSTEYKGFKKKIIAQTSVAANNISDNLSPTESTPLNSSKSVKSKKVSAQSTISSESRTVLFSHQALPDGAQSSAQLTEYAQYLGLQPTVKFKCYKCGESGFPSMLKLQEHQIVCFKNLTKMQSILKPVTTPTSSSLSEQVQAPSTNFRITRKVYLCSACGTYYENWNLFLHMKEVHKRHICLFCLGMFSQADKLASHLSAKHGVVEGAYTSSDHFIGENKGSCFLMCCTCERIFTERDNFYEHSCSEGLIINAEKACSLCGLRGAHFPTCRRAFTDSSSTSPPPSNLAVPAPVESPAEPISNSQLGDRPASGTKYNTKYLVPVRREKKSNSGSTVHENEAESREKSKDLSDVDDDYDISNAAEYCHVNIDEPQEKQKGASLNKLKTYKAKNKEVAKKDDAEPKESTPNEKKKEEENAEKTVDASDDIKDKEEKDKSVNTETSAVEKECVEKDKVKVTETSVSPAVVDNRLISTENKPEDGEQVQKETEPENADDNLEVNVDLDIPSKPRPNSEDETNEDRPTELHEENISKLEEKDNSETNEEPETKEKLPTELVASPETSPQDEIKQVLKTSATEAESESESSDSGEESDSSSSSDASSEESDHHEDSRNEMKIESGGDNEDSDKMSLIVDENRSEEGDEPDVEKSDESDKQNKELKEEEVKNIKEEEQESDVEMADNTIDDNEENKSLDEERPEEIGESIQLAGDEVPLLELTLEENLDTMNIQMLLKESVKVSCLNCVYCNHAKKIAVNGKQLALHLLAEHRFAPVVCSDSGELTEVDGFADKLKSSLSELQQMFFNTDSYDNMDENCIHPYDRTYECFHCHFVTTLHKELYLHNRKMHQKTILLCIMCKSNFYSYSELLCHLCPGIYVPESNITFRCCLCTVDGLPSAFRLMVHLRKRHHACDVCLETTGDQQKLSNHVWKHKLHHLCYRCGIAYRNKPDITKHLFWKHGTESVLCKKCLQKKWPHVYHFCVPPNAFICEECNSSFTRAVALKVHKRLHAGDLPYPCEECEEKFISRKLLMKHQEKHREPSYEAPPETSLQENGPVEESDSHDENEDKLKLNSVSMQETGRVNQEHPTCENVNLKIEIKEEEHVNEPASADCLSKAVEEESAMETSVDASCSDPPKMEDKDANEKKSKVLDVYDLPPLNLSSDSDDSDEDSEPKTSAKTKMEKKQTESTSEEITESTDDKKISDIVSQQEDETQPPVPIIDGIWENFKNYKANLEKRESQQTESGQSPVAGTSSLKQRESVDHLHDSNAAIVSVIHMDHDYCGPAVGTSQSTHLEQSEGPQLEGETSQSLLPLTDTGTTDEAKEKSDEEMKACDADHNYCYTNTCSLSVEDEKEKEQAAESVSSTISPSKKKQKSPKKKQKRSASSSSSDSSSSDSSTCSCGTNCSCSSSSSSSSGSSSSQSSDSDSSSSEGRRRQAARRERRKERAKKRKVEEVEESAPEPSKVEVPEVAENGPPEQEDAVAASNLNVAEPEEAEMAVRESDLDTDETETDEDFYDKYPQKLANKLLAEKRNQLLLLAAVAPVNNGTMSQSCPSPPPSSVEEPVPKKKAKTKRHKRSHQQSHTSIGNRIKLNIPTNYYAAQNPVFSKSLPTSSSTVDPPLVATPARGVQSPFLTNHPEPSTPTAAYQSTGSGSETDSKRLSKRKRVPKRFYGDSSDEEQEQQPPSKWRKVSTTASNSPVPTAQPAPTFTYKATPILETVREPSPPSHVNEDKSEDEVADDSDSEHDEIKKSSSDSSNSESEVDKEPDGDDGSDVDTDVETPSTVQTNVLLTAREGDSSVQQKNENLYCYCQCPYDEVSEMIACDGKDCTIEWFHFECVGIMVPPKGKWFCPDCRKRAAARSEYLLNV